MGETDTRRETERPPHLPCKNKHREREGLSEGASVDHGTELKLFRLLGESRWTVLTCPAWHTQPLWMCHPDQMDFVAKLRR